MDIRQKACLFFYLRQKCHEHLVLKVTLNLKTFVELDLELLAFVIGYLVDKFHLDALLIKRMSFWKALIS